MILLVNWFCDKIEEKLNYELNNKNQLKFNI